MNAQLKCLTLALLTLLLTSMGLPLAGQDRCGVMEHTEIRRSRKSLLESDTHFEKWLKEKKERDAKRSKTLGTTYRIPVVVHIIHKGESVGTGTNISNVQVISQIDVLNSDFNRLNADAVNTPSEFQSVAGSVEIDFVLATRTPDGLYTAGIVRKEGSKNQWTVNDDETLKALSYWPAEDYLNIWVTDLSSTLLGYAQFPIADIAGLEDSQDSRLTDGVVVDYSVFGSSEDGNFSLTTNFNKGRTTTHEVGHFLGLRHIWGDDDGACGGENDYVSDTPDQANSTSGCPSNPQTSCNVYKMFQNYMDYSNDACMNLFTVGQAARMIIVLENSPRRTSLLTSDGSRPIYTRDVAIEEILTPSDGTCTQTITPAIKIANYGAEAATNLKLQLSLNGLVVETKQTYFSPPIELSGTSEVTFFPIELTLGPNELDFEVLQTNGATDEGIENNYNNITTFVPLDADIPFIEAFTTLPERWRKSNADGDITWAVTNAGQEGANNSAVYMNFFQYKAEGETDVLTTPVLDFSVATAPYLSFDVAYAKRGTKVDGLKVFVLTGCESDITEASQIYFKEGSSLATTSSHSAAFLPSDENEWRKVIIDLTEYIGQPRVQFAFIGINDNGNNLYIDNVRVVKEVFENVAISSISSPAPITCNGSVTPKVVVANEGNVTINSLTIRYIVNNETEQVFNTVVGLNLQPGNDTTIVLPEIRLGVGNNTFSVEATEPNSVKDIDVSDNKKVINIVVNSSSDIVPLRENFDDDLYRDDWTIVNPSGGISWEQSITNYNISIKFNAVDDALSTDKVWFATPVLDFSGVVSSSMFFDAAFSIPGNGNRTAGVSNLRILASLDCGSSYEMVVFDGSQEPPDNDLVLTVAPDSEDDWDKMYVNLNELAGNEQVRLAFVVANDAANITYIDNIEFFLSDDQAPPKATNPFIVYDTDQETPENFFLTFNLDERRDVTYDLVDMMGKIILTQDLADVLNQTYTVESDNTSPGVYIIRICIDGAAYVERIFMGR